MLVCFNLSAACIATTGLLLSLSIGNLIETHLGWQRPYPAVLGIALILCDWAWRLSIRWCESTDAEGRKKNGFQRVHREIMARLTDRSLSRRQRAGFLLGEMLHPDAGGNIMGFPIWLIGIMPLAAGLEGTP